MHGVQGYLAHLDLALFDVAAQQQRGKEKPAVHLADVVRQAGRVRLHFHAGGGLVQTRTLGAQGFGERQPVAANTRPDGSDDPDGRQKNRRVEVVCYKW